MKILTFGTTNLEIINPEDIFEEKLEEKYHYDETLFAEEEKEIFFDNIVNDDYLGTSD